MPEAKRTLAFASERRRRPHRDHGPQQRRCHNIIRQTKIRFLVRCSGKIGTYARTENMTMANFILSAESRLSKTG
jgi:hypothetical protein